MGETGVLDFLGWAGSLLLGVCALPQAIQSFREGKTYGLSPSFIALWGIGEIFLLIYILPQAIIPLIVNYFFNLACLAVIVYYVVWPRHDDNRL